MRSSRTVLRALQLRDNAHALSLPATRTRPASVTFLAHGRPIRYLSSTHNGIRDRDRDRHKPSAELITRLETSTTSQQLKDLLVKATAADSQSGLVPIITDILRKRNELEYTDCTYILRDLRYALSNPHRDQETPTPVEESRSRLQTILRELKETGRWLDATGQSEMVRINVLLGDQVALDVAKQTISSWGESKWWNLPQWNAYVEYLNHKNDVEGLEGVIRNFKQRQQADTPIKALEYLVAHKLQEKFDSKSDITAYDLVAVIEGVQKLEESGDQTRIWGAAIRRLMEQKPGQESISVAMEVHDILRDRRLETDNHIAMALLEPLCAGDEPRLDQAMVIYAEYLASDSKELVMRDTNNSVFSTILATCARCPSEANTTIALRVLNDMRARHISFSTPLLTSTAVAVIRSSPDHRTAFNLYAHLYALNSQALDRRAYDQIMTAFIKLSTTTSPFAPAHYYIEIMGDMRKSGFNIGTYAVTSLLTSYGSQARSSRHGLIEPEARRKYLNALLVAITELHTMIKLDPSYTVDIPLLNALMDAYSRVRAFSEVFEVWEELLERRPREDPKTLSEIYAPSISIYLDACGYSYSLARARKAWAWATRWKIVNARNWDAWLECLCRNGRIAEAHEVVMRIKNGVEKGGPEFHLGMVELLLKFSRRDSRRDADLARIEQGIKEDFPEYWEQKSIV